MEIGKRFRDIYSYNKNMSKGLEDKLFFIKHLDINKENSYIFVDFGCADGVIIDTLYEIMDANEINCYFIGYDISDTMIELAKIKFNHPGHNVLFTTSWDEVKDKLNEYSDMKSIMILSSVIHEVYSYARQDSNDITDFWKYVKNSGFDYVCVRDMMCSEDINRKPNKSILDEVKYKISCSNDLCDMEDDFEKRWGSIEFNNKNLIHFLLKYRWQINWDRELNEDYFPIYISELLDRMDEKYNITYFKRFRVPFLDDCWKEDFNVELEDYTHIKAIFEIKKY